MKTHPSSSNNEDADMTWEIITLAGVSVSLSEPPSKDNHGYPKQIRGVVFLLTGAMIPEREYESTRRVLCLERGLAVIGLYTNVLTTAHAWYAEKIPLIYQAYREKRQQHAAKESQSHPYKDGFHVVGHSVGGKISLLLATRQIQSEEAPNKTKSAKSSTNTVRAHSPVLTVLALDPVDLNPSKFTGKNQPKPSLTNQSKVFVTWADASSAWTIPRAHNANSIYKALKEEGEGNSQQANNKQLQPLIVHHGAGHMAYTDFGGGWLGHCLMRGGKKEANHAALDQVHELIRREF